MNEAFEYDGRKVVYSEDKKGFPSGAALALPSELARPPAPGQEVTAGCTQHVRLSQDTHRVWAFGRIMSV